MTAVAIEVPREVSRHGEPSTANNLAADARALARAHLSVRRGTRRFPRIALDSPLARALEKAETRFATSTAKDPATAKAAEWFLDNYYLVRRVARQVDEELPGGFIRRLPELASGPGIGSPRIYAVARAFIAATDIEPDINALRGFLSAYQEITAFTIAELWALPTVLRASVLCALVHFLGELRILRADAQLVQADCWRPLQLEPAIGVERAIRTLRLLADIDWKTFFEKMNRVEAILRTDPARVYESMDFATCDSYRKAVEELAWSVRATEEDVAKRAVAFAIKNESDARTGHVGYYLLGAGRPDLEREIGYRAQGIERVRRIVTRRPTLALLSLLALFTLAPVLAVTDYLQRRGSSVIEIAGGVAVTIIPASMIAVAFVQWAMARLLSPRSLPKIDFSKGIPQDARTLVVTPTMLGRTEDVERMIRQIELHYLANPDPRLQFAILTDYPDSKSPPKSSELVDEAGRAITALNTRHGRDGVGPFHLLHRDPLWNPAEGCFMGWERKRGKLEELNQLLRGKKDTSYARHVGDPQELTDIRFVITLDSDTQLPMGTAHRLIGVLAHPLNRAVYDPVTGQVIAGYTIVQPRIETSPSSSRLTFFSRVFAGDIGFDIYTHAVSDLYQDLFSTGIYVGKGIYEVDAFVQMLEGRVPENALASHDLFEGIHARAALASDIALFEDYPSHYLAYARRMHRWVRGDWQLLPWLLATVPAASGERIANPVVLVDRWKIVDNLRRSLTSPALFLLLVSSWTWLPGRPWVWSLGALAVLLFPVLPGLLRDRRRTRNVAHGALALVFLAHETMVIVDALVRVLARMAITHKHMLEWVSAADTTRRLSGRATRAVFWREMFPSLLLTAVTAALIVIVRPSALVVAGPVLGLWVLAPEIARWVSEPRSHRVDRVGVADLRNLRRMARRTWLFFETFVGPNDQWLPIDNHQEEPHTQTAHRTSPTNIGMMLLSVLSAYDLGYVGVSELSLRLRMALESVARMAHYQGHLLNWYETKNLEPLLPRYVSTVDSGNFAGCLLTIKQACYEVAQAPVLRAQAWDGLSDSLDLLEETVEGVAAGSGDAFRSVIVRMREALQQGRSDRSASYSMLVSVSDESGVQLDRELLRLLETGAYRHEPKALDAMRTWVDRLHHQVDEMRKVMEQMLPWLSLRDEPAARAVDLPTEIRLDQIPGVSRKLIDEIDKWERGLRERGSLSLELEVSANRLRKALESSSATATTLVAELFDLAARADAEANGMDFRLLFDRERKLFRIGYNVTLDQVDAHHYDLLASEARLASFLAIVKGHAPESHWYALGRPMTRVADGAALLSWGGTMFEYLMPNLLMRSHEGTLLAQSCELAVKAQVAYGKQNDAPWGVSECAYSRVDASDTYQYRAFGVPGLGFKRGLEDDLVVAPYASMLAVSLEPRAVVDNLKKLESMGMVGTYGLFEALDLHPERAPDGHRFAVVRSYMAHHQGMLLVALNNFLNGGVMVKRFHSEPSIETGEMLLNERTPATVPPEWPIATSPINDEIAPSDTPSSTSIAWSPQRTGRPQAHLLSNGRLTSILGDSGGGGLRWQGIEVTKYRPDPTRDDDGMSIHLRDEETGRVWTATSEQGRTTYATHKAEFHHRDHGISVHVDVAVAPADDVEVREITLHNETDQPRRLTVTSVSEPVLQPLGEAARHPAFSRMFVESERVADLDGLLFARHPKSPAEERAFLVQRLVRDGAAVLLAGYETDRAALFGRCQNERIPMWLAAGDKPRTGRVGAVVDPVASLTASIELKPNRMVTLAFVTSVGRSRNAALELARKYGSMHAVRWVFRDADHASARRVRRAGLVGSLMPDVQRLFSALLFAYPAFRAPPDVRGGAKPCKSSLWGRGISGDDPILLVRVRDAGAHLIVETIAAQRFLRSCGVRIELVLLDEQPSGYVTEGSAMLRTILIQQKVDDLLNQHGGIFLLAADQISADERRAVEASARVVLDTRDGPLASCLGRRTPDLRPNLPLFEPSLMNDEAPRPVPRPRLNFDNGIGGFSEDGREYVLCVGPGHVTPAPWCNVLANPQFGCLVSESSLGSTWSLNSGENRLTPWRNDPVFDVPSEVLYLRDEETAAIWSSTPLPAGRGAETLVRHGAGYTTYTRESHGLEQELTVFVPSDASLKIVRLRLRNTLPRHRRLTATYYAEWVLGSMREDQQAYVVSEFDEANACLRATCSWNAEFAGRVAFLASELKPHGFTTDRTEFLGRRGDYARPEALERWGLSGSVDAGVDPCAALQVHLDLAPGERIETHFVLGQAADAEEASRLVARFRDRAAVDAEWTGLGAFWDDLLGSVRVKTPEPAMDLMLNRWLLYQCVSSRLFGRTGFYQSSGAFGYRDQLQDVLALMHAAPDRTRAQILDAASHQFEEGDVLHWWHPPSGRGVRTRCSDDLLWLPFVTAEYVKATGDVSILRELVPYLKGDVLRPEEHDRYAQYETSSRSESLHDHCRRALDHGATRGSHGLPLMAGGDWNDGLNHVGAKGRGESIWLAWFLYATMKRFAALDDRMTDGVAASKWWKEAQSLRASIEANAWDGAWYLRAFHDDGSLVGSATERECSIDSIAQSWAVLSGAGDDTRAALALRAADERLVRENDRLVLLLWPPFENTLHDPGYIRAYPPGIRENGGQYTHAATWLGWAHAARGDGSGAEHIFRLLNPILRTTTREASDRYRVEPYVLAGDVYSASPWVGRGGWSWYTGAAAWAWRLGVEAILGLRKEEGQLHINPCIPSEWKGFEAWVRLGKQTLHVVVDNPDAVSSGVARLTVDGADVQSKQLTFDPDMVGQHEIFVRLGTSCSAPVDSLPSEVRTPSSAFG